MADVPVSGARVAQFAGAQAAPDQELEWVIEDARIAQKNVSANTPLNLHFVAETGTARPRGTTRHLIRSHARRNRTGVATQSRVIPLVRHEPSASNNVDTSPKGSTPQRKAPCNSSSLQLNLYRAPKIGLIDPFDTLPIGGHEHVQALLNHWDRVFRHSRAVIEPREKWLSLAISDPAILNTTLFITALNISGLHGRVASPDLFYYKGETIRIINNRLGDRAQMATDATIWAVASLVMFENLVGTADSARIHMDGVEAMVKSRGGLQELGGHGIPRRLITWSDSCASIVLETKTRFEATSLADGETNTDWGPLCPLSLLYQATLFNLTGSSDLSEEIIDVHWHLRNLSVLKEATAINHVDGETMDKIPFGDMLERLERRIVSLAQLEPISSPTQTFAIYVLFGYAALVHIYIFMRDLSKDLPFMYLLSSRIRAVVENVDAEKLQRQYPEMMLWILIMAGLGGSPLSERDWFANRIADFCQELGLHGGSQIASMLEDFLWLELYRSPVTEGFWTAVARAQGFETGYETRRLSDQVSIAIFNAPPSVGG